MSSLYLSEWDAIIRWQDTGLGHPLIFLPGISLPAAASFFTVCADPRLKGRRCITIDFLGSGLSDSGTDFSYSPADHARAIAQILDHLGLSDCDFVGLSMGGSVGIALAIHRPDLVGRLMVAEGNIEPGGGGLTNHVNQYGAKAFVEHGHADLVSSTRDKGISGNVRAALLAGGWSIADPAAMYANANTLVNLPKTFRDEFLALEIPITFAYGAKSHPDATGSSGPDTPDPAMLHANGIATVTIPDAGHGMETDNPAGLVDAVLDAFPVPT